MDLDRSIPKLNPSATFQRACATGCLFTIRQLLEANFIDVNYLELEDAGGQPQNRPSRTCRKNAKKKPSFPRLSPLKYAIKYATPEIVHLLLEEGADVNEMSRSEPESVTPLIFAVQLLRIKVVKLLLDYGANATLKDSSNKTALNHAFEQVNERVILRISACKFTVNVELFFLLLKHGCKLGDTTKSVRRYKKFCVIFQAVLLNDTKTLRSTLANMSDVERHLIDLGTPRSHAIKFLLRESIQVLLEFQPREVIFGSIEVGTLQVLEYLFEVLSLDVNTRNDRGETLLLRSSCDENKFVFFLEHGADPKLRSDCNEFPTYEVKNFDDCSVMKYFGKLSLVDLEFVKNQVGVIYAGHFRSVMTEIEFLGEKLEPYLLELDTLRNERISQSTPSNPAITMFDYLFLKPKESVRFSGNDNLEKLYKESGNDFRKIYPHYGFAINYQYRRGMRRKFLMEAAKNTLFATMGLKKDVGHIASEIFQYFNNNTLIRLTR